MGLRWGAVRRYVPSSRNDHIHLFSTRNNARRVRDALEELDAGGGHRMRLDELWVRDGLVGLPSRTLNIPERSRAMDGNKPAFKHPPVYTAENGVSEVLPSDIIRSEVGQRLIREAAASSLGRKVPQGSGTDTVPR